MLTRRWLLSGLAVIAAAGVPVLSAGYGADPDAWLVASAAEKLWTTGRYAVSRFPGYPLHEIVSAPLIGLGGCAASNAGTLVAALLCAALWYRIARTLARSPLTLFFSLICAPLVLTNAATTMDYLWSLAFLLAAFACALENREIAAGIFTGIAAGFRPSNLTLALPLFLLISLRNDRASGFRFLFCAAAAACTSFLPVLVTYGGPVHWFILTREEMGDIHPAFDARVIEFGYRLIYAAGPLAFIALGAAALRGRKRLAESVRDKDPVMVSSMVAVTVMIAQFFALPLDRAYLLPALPFALILADRLSSPRASLALFVCIASLNFVNPDIIRHERSGNRVAPNIREGRLAESWTERTAMAELRQKTLEKTGTGAGRP
ncbi:MAG TPA: hypothetical protein VK569_02420 [Bacteroidota bacterium]|nr:hypothetical protein [Bacteroidota bacterium]